MNMDIGSGTAHTSEFFSILGSVVGDLLDRLLTPGGYFAAFVALVFAYLLGRMAWAFVRSLFFS